MKGVCLVSWLLGIDIFGSGIDSVDIVSVFEFVPFLGMNRTATSSSSVSETRPIKSRTDFGRLRSGGSFDFCESDFLSAVTEPDSGCFLTVAVSDLVAVIFVFGFGSTGGKRSGFIMCY